MWITTTAAAAVMAVLGTAAMASSGDGSPSSHDDWSQHTAMTQQVEVRADAVMEPSELGRSGLRADDTVTVTTFPSSGRVDRSSANGG